MAGNIFGPVPPADLTLTATLRASDSAWIETFTGKRFYVLDPRVEDVCIEDIAHALSLLTRFTGHTREFYSVAQHSLLVSQVCDPADALSGLLHDGSEAYLADLNSPLKHSPEMSRYRTAERHVQAAVQLRFGLPKEPTSVKLADKRLLVTEKRDLLAPSPDWPAFIGVEPLSQTIRPMSPDLAEFEFLYRFRQLTNTAVPQADGWTDQEMDVHGS